MTRKKPPGTKTPRSRDDFLIATSKEVDEAVTTSGKSSKGKGKATLASKADKLDLYEGSVQEPRKECRNLEAMYKDLIGAMPRILREDFCSTAMIAMAWLQSPDVLRKSIGVDIDPVMIKRAEEIRQRDNVSRITLIQASVLEEHTAPSADLIAALNYAIFYFHKREDAVRYLRLSKDRLRQTGCIILDLFGGESDMRSGKKYIRTNAEGVQYWLEESRRDVLTNTVKLALSFRMRDGSWVKNAFIYDFRVYSIAEVLEMMKEAGYSKTAVYINELSSPRGQQTRDNDDESDTEDGDDGLADKTGSWDEYKRVPPNGKFHVSRPFNAYIVAAVGE